jgi:hypothetical protein
MDLESQLHRLWASNWSTVAIGNRHSLCNAVWRHLCGDSEEHYENLSQDYPPREENQIWDIPIKNHWTALFSDACAMLCNLCRPVRNPSASLKEALVHWRIRLTSCCVTSVYRCAPNTLCLTPTVLGDTVSSGWDTFNYQEPWSHAQEERERERERELAGLPLAVVHLPHSATFWGPLQYVASAHWRPKLFVNGSC